MKAAQINGYGDPSVIEVVDIDKPKLTAGQVLVEVHASSINPFDAKLRAGYMKDFIPIQFPFTLGGDIAGVIAEVGESVEGLVAGDKIYGQAAGVAGNSGALAEFAATKAGQVAKAPEGLDFAQVASLPLVGVSALQGITEHIGLQPGQKLFIHGGAGGIGQIAIQIAKHIGAYVATTASGDNIQAVMDLGADEVIDYKARDFAEALSGYDAVFDTVGGDDFTKSLSILKRGGVAVSMIATADESTAQELDVTTLTQSTHTTAARLDKLRELVESGVVTPHVGKIYSLDNIQAAFTDFEAGAVHGKAVIAIRQA